MYIEVSSRSIKGTGQHLFDFWKLNLDDIAKMSPFYFYFLVTFALYKEILLCVFSNIIPVRKWKLFNIHILHRMRCYHFKALRWESKEPTKWRSLIFGISDILGFWFCYWIQSPDVNRIAFPAVDCAHCKILSVTGHLAGSFNRAQDLISGW